MKKSKYKSLFIFCLALMIFAGLTCVCAQDMDNTNSTEIDDDISLEDETLSANDEDTLADGETFNDLQKILDNASSGSTVTLDKDYTSSGSEITIFKSLTIDGKSHTLDANGSSRILLADRKSVV